MAMMFKENFFYSMDNRHCISIHKPCHLEILLWNYLVLFLFEMDWIKFLFVRQSLCLCLHLSQGVLDHSFIRADWQKDVTSHHEKSSSNRCIDLWSLHLIYYYITLIYLYNPTLTVNLLLGPCCLITFLTLNIHYLSLDMGVWNSKWMNTGTVHWKPEDRYAISLKMELMPI